MLRLGNAANDALNWPRLLVMDKDRCRRSKNRLYPPSCSRGSTPDGSSSFPMPMCRWRANWGSIPRSSANLIPEIKSRGNPCLISSCSDTARVTVRIGRTPCAVSKRSLPQNARRRWRRKLERRKWSRLRQALTNHWIIRCQRTQRRLLKNQLP
jgi:hypothetical protein